MPMLERQSGGSRLARMLLASPTYPCNDTASQIVHLRHTLVNELLGILATSGAYSAAAPGEQLPC